MVKTTIELVVKSNFEDYSKLYDKSYQDAGNLWFLHTGWYTKIELENSWNTETYIIRRGKVAVGYFGFTKYHQDLRVRADGIYLLPKYRKAELFAEMLLFTGNRVFIEHGYEKIGATAHVLNDPVVKLYDRFMTREGVVRDHYRYGRKRHAKIIWGILFKESPWAKGKEITLTEMMEGI